jgi:hypothetical protein
MFDPTRLSNPRLLVALLTVGLALIVVGCGSSETSPTSTAASTGASAPVSTTPPAVVQSTATTPKTTTAKTPEQHPSATATTPKTTTPARPKVVIVKRTAKAPASVQAPPRYIYPPEAQGHFIAFCTTGGGSKTSCECVIAKYEARKVPHGTSLVEEEGETLSELLGIEVGLKDHLPLNTRAIRYARECHSAIT